MNMRKNIGLRLSQARKEKNLTQEQLAERTSFSVSEISRIETGRNDAPLGTLKKLCDTLDIGLDFLLYDSLSPDSGFSTPTLQQINPLLEPLSEEDQKYYLEIIRSISSLSKKNIPSQKKN